jgi:hypothetical protein
MIYSGLWQEGDLWANCGCGRQAVYDISESLVGRPYMG